jgi:invasion protein IalB
MVRRGGLALAGGLLVIVGAGIAFWQWTAPVEAPTSATFGFEDWLVRCQTTDGKAGCGISQQILDQKSRRPLLQLHLARAAAGEGHQLVIVLPLGVTVPPGTIVQAGEVKRNGAFVQCLPAGCIAPIEVDDEFLAAMKSAKDGRVGVVDRVGKTIAIPFSLKGFTPALEKMEEQGGIANSDATWWTRFWNSSGTQ